MTPPEPGSAHPAERQWTFRVQSGVLLDVPLTPSEKSKPWAAVVSPDGRSPDGWGRSALPPGPRGRGYLVGLQVVGPGGRREAHALVAVGDVVEFAADYEEVVRRGPLRRPRTEPVAVRWYGAVLKTDPRYVVVWGPTSGPGAAWDAAQSALKAWREQTAITVAGLTDIPQPGPPSPAPDPSRELAPARSAPTGEPPGPQAVTRVKDDPDHGTLVVDAGAFSAAMALSVEEMTGLVRDVDGVTLTGREPKTTLAALAARHVPERLGRAGVDPASAPGSWSAAYHGAPDGTVTRRAGDAATALSPPRRSSPHGFGWGHGDETAYETAFAVLADATGSSEAATRLAGRYVADVVTNLPSGQAWSLTVAEVRAWAAEAATKTGVTVTWPTPVAAGAAAPGDGAGL